MSYIFGSENFVKTYMDLVFCLLRFIFLGSHLAKILYFWIHLAYNKEQLNEKTSNGRFSRPCCPPYANVEHWKKCSLYFWVPSAHDFCQRLYL